MEDLLSIIGELDVCIAKGGPIAEYKVFEVNGLGADSRAFLFKRVDEITRLLVGNYQNGSAEVYGIVDRIAQGNTVENFAVGNGRFFEIMPQYAHESDFVRPEIVEERLSTERTLFESAALRRYNCN